MSKAQQTSTYTAAQNQQAANTTNEDSANQQLQGVLGTAQGTAAGILPGITSGYSDIAGSGGGVNSTADSTYQNLATTGGISPSSIQAMKDEASQAAQGSYQTAQAQAQRTAAATGGYGDTSAIQANLARTGSQAASTAATNELASITGLQQQGMEAGASGLATEQQNVTSNKLAALGGSTNIYGMNESQVSTTVSQILQNYQQTGTLNNQDLSVLTNLANQPGVFSQIVSTLGTLGGAAGSIIKGINT
jgi:hypothetical protein